MPNHIKNRLKIVGYKDHLKSVLDNIQSKDENGDINPIDFNKFLPMPKELEGVDSPVKIISNKDYIKQQKELAIRKKNPKPNDDFFGIFGLGGITQEMSDDFINRFGTNNWYDWKCTHWGTKWGAYSCAMGEIEQIVGRKDYEGIEIEFETAWSCAAIFVLQLSEAYPTVEFTLTYADESPGSNCGKFLIIGGIDRECDQPVTGTDEAIEYYYELWGRGDWDWVQENDE